LYNQEQVDVGAALAKVNGATADLKTGID